MDREYRGYRRGGQNQRGGRNRQPRNLQGDEQDFYNAVQNRARQQRRQEPSFTVTISTDDDDEREVNYGYPPQERVVYQDHDEQEEERRVYIDDTRGEKKRKREEQYEEVEGWNELELEQIQSLAAVNRIELADNAYKHSRALEDLRRGRTVEEYVLDVIDNAARNPNYDRMAFKPGGTETRFEMRLLIGPGNENFIAGKVTPGKLLITHMGPGQFYW